MEILTIETPSLGDRSYVVTDGEAAAVVDPQRDIDRVLQLLDERGLRVTAVLETHVHNDYVTGGPELARRTGARYHVPAQERFAVAHTPIGGGDTVAVGPLRLRAVHTPGHTPTHLAYVVDDGTRDAAVFTGGSMLYGSVGRTDLISPDRTEELTRLQYRSVNGLLAALDPATEVRPTHGFGSFCSSGATAGRDRSTIADERGDNQAAGIGEDEFVHLLMAGMDAYPAYYAHMGAINRAGPADVDLTPAPTVDPSELVERIAAGEWVVDLRARTAFAAAHVRGTINIQLAPPASTYLGWLIPWGTPVTLLADTDDDVADMQRQLVRIGIDRPAGRVTEGLPQPDGPAPGGDGPEGPAPGGDGPGGDGPGGDGPLARAGYPVADFGAVHAARKRGEDPWILDVRRNRERAAAHVRGSHHIPLHELADRLDQVPAGHEVWVHCATGYRAAIAASLLHRAVRSPVLIDDDFDDAEAAGLDVVAGTDQPARRASEHPQTAPEHDATAADHAAAGPGSGRAGTAHLDSLAAVLHSTALAAQEHFGDREPTDAELRAFLRDRLLADGVPPDRADALLDSLDRDDD